MREVDRKTRQQRVHEVSLPLAQLVTFAPAKEGARVMPFGIHRDDARAAA
jgi:hypothetical protein